MIRKKAFTLLELMIVVAIIGVLSSITVVTYGNVRSRSQVSKAKADVSSIESAIKLLFQDTKEYPFHYQANCKPPQISPRFNLDMELPIVNNDDAAQVGSYCAISKEGITTDEWYAKCAENNNAARKMTGLAGAMGLLKNDSISTGGTPYKNWAGPYIDQIPESDPWGAVYMWEGDYVCTKGEIGEDDYACQGLAFPLENKEGKSYNVVTAVSSYGPTLSNECPVGMSEEDCAKRRYTGYGGDNVSVLGCKR